jgi:hypothetical protein
VVLCRVWACLLLESEVIRMESLETLFLVYVLALGALGWLYWMVNEFS